MWILFVYDKYALVSLSLFYMLSYRTFVFNYPGKTNKFNTHLEKLEQMLERGYKVDFWRQRAMIQMLQMSHEAIEFLAHLHL